MCQEGGQVLPEAEASLLNSNRAPWWRDPKLSGFALTCPRSLHSIPSHWLHNHFDVPTYQSQPCPPQCNQLSTSSWTKRSGCISLMLTHLFPTVVMYMRVLKLYSCMEKLANAVTSSSKVCDVLTCLTKCRESESSFWCIHCFWTSRLAGLEYVEGSFYFFPH